jgi:hypothetical protein
MSKEAQLNSLKNRKKWARFLPGNRKFAGFAPTLEEKHQQ